MYLKSISFGKDSFSRLEILSEYVEIVIHKRIQERLIHEKENKSYPI